MFSNSTEWDIWSSNWCERCTKDLAFSEGYGNGCPIILNGMIGSPTPEWVRQGPGLKGIICTEFEEL